MLYVCFFFSSRRRHTRCALVTGVQTCALPILDVFPSEPKGNEDPFESPLLGLDNVILTPHVGGSTLEAQDNIGVEVAAKLVRYSDNGSTLSAVNFPEVTLPGHAGSRRLLHIHRNVPGVLSQVNEVFGRHSVNIDGQYLRTDANVEIGRAHV